MRIRFQTKVSCDHQQVFKAFDRELFEYLKPPDWIAEVVRFDGSTIGDQVHLRFKFPFNTEWISEIIACKEDADRCHFVDVGTKLPFGLRSWRHEHIVHKVGTDTIIEDFIQFSGSNWLAGGLFFPVFWFSFFLRKKQYRKYFNGDSNRNPDWH